MSKQKTITAKVTIERVTDGGLTVDMATAYIEGQGVRCLVEVPSLGSRQDAAAKALLAALQKAGIDDDPPAYYPTGMAAR